jgi:hypothetical protein
MTAPPEGGAVFFGPYFPARRRPPGARDAISLNDVIWYSESGVRLNTLVPRRGGAALLFPQVLP